MFRGKFAAIMKSISRTTIQSRKAQNSVVLQLFWQSRKQKQTINVQILQLNHPQSELISTTKRSKISQHTCKY